MKFIKRILIISCLCLFLKYPIVSQGLFINEIVANNTQHKDLLGNLGDWVELYNNTDSTINLAGFYLSDSPNNLFKFRITDSIPILIQPNNFIIIWFDGYQASGPLHVAGKLSAGGEFVSISNSNQVLLDSLSFPALLENQPYGRYPDGKDLQILSQNTFLSSNIFEPIDFIETPQFSIRGGHFKDSVSVSFNNTNAATSIYYTLNGATPTKEDYKYSDTPISITKTQVVRASAIDQKGNLSTIATNTYLINEKNDFPIISLAFDEDDFFGENGIYTNYNDNIEVISNVELFENNGDQAFSIQVETEVGGKTSSILPTKSLVLKPKKELGQNDFDYQIFKNSRLKNYKSLFLRNSGQDNLMSNFRDAFVSDLARDLSDLNVNIIAPDIDLQNFRPSVVYFNGAYFALQNMRERLDWRWVEQHYQHPRDSINIVENIHETIEGTPDSYSNFKRIVDTMSSPLSDQNFEQITAEVDLDNYLDLVAFQIFIDNCDWPGNNNRKWNLKNNGKWRYMLKDLDFTFGVFSLNREDEDFNQGIYSQNSLKRMLDPHETEHPAPYWSTFLFRKLFETEAWRNSFINRTADFMNTIFEQERMLEKIENFNSLYKNETKRFEEKSNVYRSKSHKTITGMKRFAANRKQAVLEHFSTEIPSIKGHRNLSLSINEASAGSIQINSISLEGNNLPWEGTYFKGIPVQLTAKAKEGFEFVGWQPESLPQQNIISVDVLNHATVKAIFRKTAMLSLEPIIINEINYNSNKSSNTSDWLELYNSSDKTVDLSNWTLSNGDDAFTIPENTTIAAQGFVILCENKADFQTFYQNTNTAVGDFGGSNGFKLKNSSGTLLLSNPTGQRVDSIFYVDDHPFPVEADGSGATLQLKDPSFDNLTPENWFAQTATPNAINRERSSLKHQYITYEIPEIITINDDQVLIEASSSSGLKVNFDVLSGNALNNDNLVYLNGQQQKIILAATQEGNDEYAKADTVEIMLDVKFSSLPVIENCDVVVENPWSNYIKKIQIGSVSYESQKDGYKDFTSNVFYLKNDRKQVLKIESPIKDTTETNYVNIYLDINQDSSFNSETELIYESTTKGFIKDSIYLDRTIPIGIRALRVILSKDSIVDACSSILEGEINDFSTIITRDLKQEKLTSTETLAAEDILVSPNPFNHLLSIKSKNHLISKVSIYNIIGQKVLDFQNIGKTKTIGTSSLTPGVYFLKIDTFKPMKLIKI